ncbi:hypothetical protein VTK73DRAFT_9073 [Phialemonium thermophilum]|uniref:CENP-V/GFA domain-containing protein n=1 Tax=Phialemonium thermophilum TaxID=223376 RepID=A0ABR3W4P4_9PEZI
MADIVGKLVAARDDPANVWYSCYCHCGATAFKIAHRPLQHAASTPVPVVRCNCSICKKNGYLLLYVFRDQIRHVRGWDDLKTYEFASRTRKHLFCGRCGTSVAIDYLGHLDAGDIIGVNARVIQGLDLDDLHLLPFDGQAYQAEYNREFED